MLNHAGLDSNVWTKFYTAEEIEEISNNSETMTFVSGNYPIHVRIYAQPGPAPTVVMSHGIICYGLILQRMALPFFRAGYNVVHFDMPGTGQSGGDRGGCTIGEFIRAWTDAIAFARRKFGGPLYAMGNAEDGVTCYYALANHPDLSAMSIHNLFHYGDPAGAAPIGPSLKVRALTMFSYLGLAMRPSRSVKGTSTFPWKDVFTGPGDEKFIKLLEEDPLGLQVVKYRMAHTLLRRRVPRVQFEDCVTPTQVIASEDNAIWPYATTVQYYNRLGGPKELITLEGKGQWELNQAFHEMYCGHVMDWFGQHGAAPPAADVTLSATIS